MAEKLSVSVRNLVEFILRAGDIDNSRGYRDADAMQEGSRIHRKIQKSMPSGYTPDNHEIIRICDSSLKVPGK